MDEHNITLQWVNADKDTLKNGHISYYEQTMNHHYIDPVIFEENFHAYNDGPTTIENEFSSVSNHSSSDPLDDIDINCPIVFTILHKPRGSKGVWSQLSMNQRVRVTYGRGKNLQLLIRSTHEHYLHEHGLALYLEQKIEDNWHVMPSDGFSIEKKHPVTNDISDQFPNHPYLVRYDVKIFVIHKLISFRIDYCESPDQPLISTRSVEIFTHNSGRRECLKQQEKQQLKKISTIDQVESSHNLSIKTDYTENQWEVVDTNLNVNGIVRAQNFQQYSDLRLKSNIEDLVDALNIVTSLKGKTYQWKKGSDPSENETSGNKVIGLIAQEVMQVLPEVVDEVDGILSIRYTEIIPVLIEAFKQQAFQFEEFKKNINDEVSDIKEKIDTMAQNRDIKSSQEAADYLKMQQEAAMLYLQAWMKSVNQPDKLSDQGTCGACKVNMPDTTPKKKDKSLMGKIKSFSDNKWKIFAIVLLSILIIAGITVGLYYIILRSIHNSPNLSSNLMLNPSFEDIDTHGKASGWIGNYWLLTTNEEIADSYNSEDQTIYWIPSTDDIDEWPFAMDPVHGHLMLHTFVNSTHNNNFYAYASVPFLELNTEKIKYLNVSTWASSYFNLNSSMLSSAFQLNIIINYDGDESEAYGLDFDYDDKRKWNYREIIIKVDEVKKLEYVEVIIVSTFEGYSFWDSVNLQYITSNLPSVVRLGKKRELKECNGVRYCT